MSEVDGLTIALELHNDKLVVKLTRRGEQGREFISADAIALDDLRHALSSAPVTLERGSTSMDSKPDDWKEPGADDELGKIVTPDSQERPET